jgi:hypothetical protein
VHQLVPSRNTKAAASEEFEDVMARLEDLALERLAAAHDVADAFVGFARNPDGDELAGAIEPRQVGRVALVMLALDAGPLRNERRGDDVARVSPLLQRSMQDVAGAAGFVAGVDLAVVCHPVDPFLQFRQVGGRGASVPSPRPAAPRS